MQNKIFLSQHCSDGPNYGVTLRHEYQRRVHCPDLVTPGDSVSLDTVMRAASAVMLVALGLFVAGCL